MDFLVCLLCAPLSMAFLCPGMRRLKLGRLIPVSEVSWLVFQRCIFGLFRWIIASPVLLSSPRMPMSLHSQRSDTGMLGVDGREEPEETCIMAVSWGSRTWAKTHGNIGVG